MDDFIYMRGGQRIRVSEYPKGMISGLNARLDAIAAEDDVELLEATA